MKALFNIDPYPGRPKILFIGFSTSTHTHSWIDLLAKSELNVRLFALPGGTPPENWKVKTYVTTSTALKLDPNTRTRLYSPGRIGQILKKGFAYLLWDGTGELEARWLARVIRRWQPDVIHTLGLDPAGYFYFRTRNKFKLAGIGKWVLQLRGGSDLTLSRLDPETSIAIGRVLRECDQLISDNEQNFSFALEMGIREEQISQLAPVPGTGGIDVTPIAKAWQGFPSSRRIILWPKAYECPWSKALPVFEAIKLSWDRIQPCEIYMIGMIPETRMWYWTLPERIRRSCHTEDRISRDRALELMVRARVMLAPSLVDGTPNSMFEAMAAGAFPIVSPLETIRPLVENERNVLFARNLYPDEITEALCRAMSDDALVDSAAQKNLEVVRKRADRSKIRPRVIEYYERLAIKKVE